MIALLQRVTEAQVVVNGECVGKINQGLLVLVGVEPADNEAKARRLCERLLSYRVFADSEEKMNLSLSDIRGGLLLVPQFTLAADTRKGNRPSFSSAASPEQGRCLFETLVSLAKAQHEVKVQTGVFGADMKVSLTNDGPVTFTLTV